MGQDFSNADKGKKFSKGGDMKKMNMGGYAGGGKMAKGGMAMFEKSNKDIEKKGMKEGSKKEMAMDRMQMMGMKKGGMAEGGMSDIAQDKAMIKKAFKQHDAQEHKGGKGTFLKLASGGYTKAADGCAQRGKTKGTQIKMMGGGAC